MLKKGYIFCSVPHLVFMKIFLLNYPLPVELLAHYKQSKNNGVRSIILGA